MGACEPLYNLTHELACEPICDPMHKPMRKRESAPAPSFEFFFTSTEKTLLSQKLISYLPTKSCGFKYNGEYML